MEFESYSWPRKNGKWFHSDIKNIAYYFVSRFYDSIVKAGEK